MNLVRFILVSLLALVQMVLNAQTTENQDTLKGVDIHVKIQNIANEKGNVYFGLYDSETYFNERSAFARTVGQVFEHQTEVTFSHVPSGVYAIICYHDENENGKMDFDGFMPAEDYGTSNNPVIFGPPQFNASKFTVSEEAVFVEIKF